MTITLRPGSTVMFTGDSITDSFRLESEEALGYGYPLRVAGDWGYRHPDRPITWLNTGYRGDKVMDLEARWQTGVLDARPDVVSILVGMNDVGWHTLDPDGHLITTADFKAGYDRLLAPLAEAGVTLILIEPFLLPISTTIEHDGLLLDDAVRKEWRADLDPKIQVVHELAHKYDAHLLAADNMFATLIKTSTPEHWSEDGVHPSPAGHAALAAAWLNLVT